MFVFTISQKDAKLMNLASVMTYLQEQGVSESTRWIIVKELVNPKMSEAKVERSTPPPKPKAPTLTRDEEWVRIARWLDHLPLGATFTAHDAYSAAVGVEAPQGMHWVSKRFATERYGDVRSLAPGRGGRTVYSKVSTSVLRKA